MNYLTINGINRTRASLIDSLPAGIKICGMEGENIKMKKKTKNKLDEMQEQKMLKIEHNACWFAFWGLFAALAIQALIYGANGWRYMAGEWIVFMCLALYISVDCIRNGVWDRRLAPTPIVNICKSIAAGIVVAVLNFTISYKENNVLKGAAAVGIISGVLCCVLCLAALTLVTSIYKKRVKHLEKEDADEEELGTLIK